MSQYIDWKRTGSQIKLIMNENGYIIKSLARELRVSESTLKNYLYSGTRIPADVLMQLVAIFHLDKIDDLLVLEAEQEKE